MSNQPIQGDAVVTPGGPCGSRYAVSLHDTPRGFLGTFGNWDEAKIAIETRMGSDMCWGDVWWCSDHGNLWRIRLEDGSEIKPGDEEHPVDSEGRWFCSVCTANMGGEYSHTYADGTRASLCEDCIESAEDLD